MDIYSRPELYDKVTAGFSDVNYYQNLARSLNGPVLELACGTGRIVGKLSQAGLNCLGLDLSEDMINVARKRYPDMEFITGDMRKFKVNKRFSLIFIALNSLLHLHTRSDLEKLFQCIKDHLNPNGEFAFSIFNPSPQILSRSSSERYPVANFVDEQTAETVKVEETTQYDASTQVSKINWYYSTPSKPDFYSHPLDMRNIFPQELDAMLACNGFEIIKKEGNHQGDPFSSSSMLQVVRSRPTNNSRI